MKRREFLKSMTALTAAGAVSAPAIWSSAKSQARNETLLLITENGPNNLDIHGVGTNRPGYEVSWNCYDRLITHEKKTLPDGTQSYDRDKLKPELAEDMNRGDMSVTFKLRKDAKFQDGTPVTAKDVKWSFDRAVTVGGFPTVQMKAGSLVKTEQFVAVDDNTFRVDFIKKDRLTLPDLAVIVPGIYNSELLKKHATEKDPWALDYTKGNTAGSGAYRVTSWKPGVETVYERFDGWVGGKLPQLKKIIWRTIPAAGNRRALMERGDADVSFDLPAKDFSEMKKETKLKLIANPITNGMYSVDLNVVNPPFNNEKVRQAVAYAIPYQKIIDAAMFGIANPLFGGKSNDVSTHGLAATHRLCHRHGKGQSADAGSGCGKHRHHNLIRPWRRCNLRACRHADPGEPRSNRHQDHHQQNTGLKLAERDGEEIDADDGELLLGLAGLSGIFLFLVLFRPERHLRHVKLREQGHGRLDRWRPRGRCRR